MKPLILASGSSYRASLLGRLALPFSACAADVDETPERNEHPAALAMRLATEKAHCVADSHPKAVVIGSDQVAELGGMALGKPGSRGAAIEQLQQSSGRIVVFHTAVCVIDPQGGGSHQVTDTTRVHFRSLQEDEIARYVATEQPLDCAGSFKCEGLGICLFERIESNDPSALIGLPLIALSRILRQCGFALP